MGFSGTSNVAAATQLGISASGTMAHSYVETFACEEDAFRAFARAHPGPLTFLVDTYDTEGGVATAAHVLADLRRGPGCAIRLDSGDLGALAHRSRALLDTAGLEDVRIIASGGLDEYAIAALIGDQAPIDVFAVGTRVGVAADAPYLDAAYKLVEYDGRPVMKLSAAKVTAPAPKQVFRRPGCMDVIGLHGEEPPDGATPLLRTVMRGGRRTIPPDSLAAARARFEADLAGLPAAARRIQDPEAPVPAASAQSRPFVLPVEEPIRLGRKVRDRHLGSLSVYGIHTMHLRKQLRADSILGLVTVQRAARCPPSFRRTSSGPAWVSPQSVGTIAPPPRQRPQAVRRPGTPAAAMPARRWAH